MMVPLDDLAYCHLKIVKHFVFCHLFNPLVSGKPLRLCIEQLVPDLLRSYRYCRLTAFPSQAYPQAGKIAVECFWQGHNNVTIVRFGLKIIVAMNVAPTYSTRRQTSENSFLLVSNKIIHFCKSCCITSIATSDRFA